MKFVMTQAICSEGMEKLKAETGSDLQVYVADAQDPNDYLDEMRGADALIVRIGKCDSHAIENSPNLKVIGRTGVGFDSVDVAKATKLGIPVVITPGANNRSVAEHAVAMIFALAKNLYEGQRELEQGNWEIRGAKKAFELKGKTVGIIGMGAIGQETAKICAGCGMKIAGYDPFMTREKMEVLGAAYYSDYHELLKVADIITIHVPLTKDTEKMISAAEFAMMKKTALVINCSRGGIVDEDDLCEALKKGVIAGAGTDVFVSEPPKPDDQLLNTPNLIVSPHSAAQTREAVVHMATMCVDGCLAVIRGEKWPFVADKSVYDHPRWGK